MTGSRTILGTIGIEYFADVSKFKSGLQKLRQEMEKSSAHIQAFQSKAKQVSQTSTIMGLALGGSLAAVAAKGADFEKRMARIGGITDATGRDFQMLEGRVRDLAQATEFTASQVADGMQFLAQAGFGVQGSMAALPDTVKLATVAMMEVGDAGDIVTNIMSGMGIKAAELGGTIDLLVSASTGANTDIRQLGEAFKFVGPIAASAGVSMEETTAAMAMMGNAGIQASLAGTAMRGAIARLLTPTKESSELINKLGLNTVISGGKITNFTGVVEQLQKSGAQVPEIMELFGLRAGPAMAALVAQGSDALAKFVTRLENAGGTADRMVGRLEQTVGFKWNTLLSKMEAAVLDLAKAMRPVTLAVIGFADTVIAYFNSMDPAWKKLITYSAALASGVLLLVGVLAGFGAIAAGVVLGFMSMATAATAFNISILPLSATILGIMAALAVIAVVGMFTIGALRRAWEADLGYIRTIVTEWIIPAWQSLFSAVATVVSGIINIIWNWKSVFATTLKNAGNIWATAVQFWADIADKVFGWIGTAIPNAIRGGLIKVIDLLGLSGTAIGNVATTIVDIFIGPWEKMFTWLGNQFKDLGKIAGGLAKKFGVDLSFGLGEKSSPKGGKGASEEGKSALAAIIGEVKKTFNLGLGIREETPEQKRHRELIAKKLKEKKAAELKDIEAAKAAKLAAEEQVNAQRREQQEARDRLERAKELAEIRAKNLDKMRDFEHQYASGIQELGQSKAQYRADLEAKQSSSVQTETSADQSKPGMLSGFDKTAIVNNPVQGLQKGVRVATQYMEEKATAALNQVGSGIANVAQNMLGKMGDIGGIVNSIQQGFQTGGPFGALFAAIAEIASRAPAFQDLIADVMDQVNMLAEQFNPLWEGLRMFNEVLRPASEMLTEVVGSMIKTLMEGGLKSLMGAIGLISKVLTQFLAIVITVLQPVFKVFGFVMKGLALVIGGLAMAIGWIINAVIDVITEIVSIVKDMVGWIPGVGNAMNDFIYGLKKARIDTASIGKAVEDIWNDRDMAEIKDRNEQAKATDKAQESMKSFSEELTNMPSTFKLALARFNAQKGITRIDGNPFVPGEEDKKGITVTNMEVKIVTDDPEEFRRRLEEVITKKRYTESLTGSTVESIGF